MNLPLNENESQRLLALIQYHVLEPEETISFDDITLIASQICQTPVAAVTLIEKDRAWFISPIGIGVKNMPREDVFCNHTIHQSNVFEVQDTLTSAIFKDHKLVLNDPRIRYYAGAALIDKKGYALGTLCVMDFKPRRLSDEQKSTLMALARQVIKLIELKQSKDRIKEDFSELQRLTSESSCQKERMNLSSKLTALGEMANGVAHELNNPVSVIDHAVEKMNRLQYFDPRSIFVIQNAVHKITNIVTGLRNYGRSGDSDPAEPLKLRTLLNRTLELYSSRAKEEGIQLMVLSDDAHVAHAREAQVTQILINLVQNAFQAVKQSEEKWINLKSKMDKDWIYIEITDSGSGIKPENREKIFDPFFTTKDLAEAAGLGLSISKKLAEKNSGSLWLDENSEQTCFVLKLPRELMLSTPGLRPEANIQLQH